jgi:dihydrofolate synthase/folylpolyglutamate synthase
MAYQETIRYLNSFINYEKKAVYPYKQSFKLERIKEFLESLGNPQDSLKCIHIAGTKGKGSVCAFTSYILKAAGYRVGLYTSPHLSDVRERMRILNPLSAIRYPADEFEGAISKKKLTDLVQKLRPAIGRYNKNSKYGALSFFEVYTALAFIYFKEKKVDFAVLETGLGGRLDATNAVNSLICAITPISYDHMQKLGNRLSEIAREKAGIIKGERPIVITAPQEKDAMGVIRNRCKETGAKLYAVGRDIIYKKKKGVFSVSGVLKEYPGLKTRLIGRHQLVNASVAVGIIEGLQSLGIKVSADSVNKGLRNAVWPGRCEVISRNPAVILDGAQNTASAKALKEALRGDFKYARLILVLGVSKDKDIKGICEELYDLADTAILTRADNPRAAKPQVLAGYFKGKGIYLTQKVKEAIILAKKLAGKKDLILVTGSLFVVGEARGHEKHKFR